MHTDNCTKKGKENQKGRIRTEGKSTKANLKECLVDHRRTVH